MALPPPPPATEPAATDAPAVDLPRPTVPAEPVEGFAWASLTVIVWLAGVVCLPLWAASAYVRFLWRLRSARPAPESWLREWQTLLAAEGVRRAGDCPSFRAAGDCPDFRAAGDCPDFRAAKMGLSPSRGRVIPLRVTDDIGPAMCWTPRGYRVFVPEGTWAELSASQRAAVLRHELAHLRRGDLWLTLLARLLALPHWFNPFAWWAVYRFTECAEWACDQAAAGPRRAAATDYAKALLRLGTASPPFPACTTAVRGSSLFTRIRRLTSTYTSEDSVMKRAIVLSAAFVLVLFALVRFELVAREPAAGGAASITLDDEMQATSKSGEKDHNTNQTAENAAPKPLFSFDRLALNADDLAEATGLNIYKFRLDIPKGQRFRVILREWRTENAAPKSLGNWVFEREEEGPTTLRVGFLPRDGRAASVLLSNEEWVQFRIDCEGCDPRGIATLVRVPLSGIPATKKMLVINKSHGSWGATEKDVTRLLFILYKPDNDPRPKQVPLVFPRAELAIVKEVDRAND